MKSCSKECDLCEIIYIALVMNRLILLLVITCIQHFAIAQNTSDEKYYVGVSYGTSFALGDFADDNIENFDAGFAKNGRKIDLYGGYFLDDKWTLTVGFRHQFFETEIDDVVKRYNQENPDATFLGTSDEWKSYYLLMGLAHKISITKKFAIYPRAAIGPMWVTNPGVSVQSDDPNLIQSYTRSSETGLGLGGEIGIGLRNDFGKHLSLMPTFTFSGGFVNYRDVETRINNINVLNNYEAWIQSFTLGISLAYRFY